ncbi:MAG TPA: DUF488 domain-containing protein [Ktedonobacterales bacterium]|nr:DUF488 domain-containing protein [Ktedonobacterales bacterium]
MTRHELTIAIKRAYDPPADSDGSRVLVDRLWPRGMAKADARIDLWLKDIAPSAELRTWFGHDPAKFDEFRRRDAVELSTGVGQQALRRLREMAQHDQITLVFAAKDTAHNDAVVLRDLILQSTDSSE